MNNDLFDPTAERTPTTVPRPPRLRDLAGATVGLLDIAKPLGNLYLDSLANELEARGAIVTRFTKPTFTRPAPPDLRREIIEQCDAVIEALADWGSCTSCSVHDIRNLESEGIPGVFVATTAFDDAAQRQAEALGCEMAGVFVAHPIQDRTDEEVREIGRTSGDMVIRALIESDA